MDKIPVEWLKTIQKLPSEPKGTIFLLGAPDTGKTTFCHVLANSLVERGQKTAVVDADVGQSDIGPPTTIGFARLAPVCVSTTRLSSSKSELDEVRQGRARQARLLHHKNHSGGQARQKRQSSTESGGQALLESSTPGLKQITPDGIYFVGDNSPRFHLLEVLVGTKRMIEGALQTDCDVVIVDSSGLVNHPYGTALKYRKIELSQPDFIFAFQRENELENIIQAISRFKKHQLIKVSVPGTVAKVSPEGRRIKREQSYASYFSYATVRKLRLDSFSIFPSKDSLSNETSGLIVGLKDACDETLGIGIVAEIDFKRGFFEVVTPVSEREEIAGITLGTLKLDSSFREAGRI